ncbi:sporulation protein YqfD [Cohnella zeiphila]|uniref:Sporulation protein YqfD n=1 Tax=Cohnella zeiphila TaxID=2761120 RepID=A0A7X0SGS8_9BACL|nr:sporulation protein YqfD [Cohnella zeiphila]MBB6729709.1 sporulation protein YqfD [Cohnella zeiphila]
MKGSWIQYARGFVTVKLAAGQPGAFLNAALADKLELWDLYYDKDEKLVFRVTVPDYFRLRPLLRRAKGRTRVMERHGLPFQMARLSRRKTFAGGLIGFVAALYVLSTLIWNVKVEGISRMSADQVLAAAKAEGVYKFQWSFRLPDTSVIADRIAGRLPEAAWVGVERNGTSIDITVVEAKKPDVTAPESPRDLVATHDAVVTYIVAENGRPKVQTNQRVRKGDVLISGIVGEGDRTKAVVSKGEVRGLVWQEYDIVSPLVRKAQAYTGAANDRKYLIIGNRALQITGYKLKPFEKSDYRSDIKRLAWGKWTLPFGTWDEREQEVVYQEQTLTAEQAKEAGLAQARKQLLAKSGKGAVIRAEKILHEQTENGKVMIKVLFEVEQSIVSERPIVQTNQLPGQAIQGE